MLGTAGAQKACASLEAQVDVLEQQPETPQFKPFKDVGEVAQGTN